MLAAKSALAIRYDALGEDTNAEMGVENRAKLEARLRQLEEKGVSTSTEEHRDCFFFSFLLCWLNRSKFVFLSARCLISIFSSQIRRISGTGKAMAKADKYQHKR